MKLNTVINGSFGIIFWFHLFITVLSWFAPFLFSWYYLLPVYLMIVLQFMVFKRCLLNKEHALDDGEDNMTFYAHLLEMVGFNFERKNVKIFCRKLLYPILTTITLFWQIFLGHEPTLF